MGYRVLVVEDELLTRKGIISKIQWDRLGIDVIDEATDGEEALCKIRSNKPDLIITDIRMPELDGLSLIKRTLEEGYNIKFIIISAYSEFDYAKNAMSYGVKNYLVKPIDPQEFEKNLKKVLEEIENESEKSTQLTSYKQQVIMKQDIRRDMILSNLLLNVNGEHLPDNIFRDNKVVFKNTSFSVAVLVLNITELLEENEEQILEDSRGIIKNIVQQYNDVIFFKNFNLTNEYILLFNVKEKDDTHYLEELVVKRILSELSRIPEIQTAAGISLVVQSVGNISKAYNQGKSAVSESILRGYCKIFRFSDFINEGLVVKEIENSKRILFSYIQNGKKDAAVSYIRHIFTGENQQFLNHIHLKILCTDVLIELEKLMRKNNLDMEQIVTGKHIFVNDVLGTGSTKQMMQSLLEIIVQVIDNLHKDKKKTSKDIIMEVVDYINSNFKEDITLKKISSMYYINPNYFCTLFRDFTGESFHIYINRIRLENAKHFLKTSDLTVNEVAEMVGFEPKYFCKVFKREIKMTPKEYMQKKSNSDIDYKKEMGY
ncbi:MAG: response regulator transcription factor [Ruminiclostridium sp.]